MSTLKRLLGVCAVSVALGALAAPAFGASSDPLFVFVPTPPPPPGQPVPPPLGSLNGPCGLAVDSTGRFFVSDYYRHAVDVFSSSASYATQLANEDPLDGPCGLALDASNNLYVNNFHRNVAKFGASPSFTPGPIFDTGTPSGVAVDASNNVYVDDRTYIQEYDSNGTPIQQIGSGNLGNGYGVAVSGFPATLGYVYVPDASTNTVKVYNPVASLTTPITEIKTPLNQPFVSLRDSAVAVDWVTGDVYIADNTQPQYTEKPQATIYVYRPAAIPPSYSYKGHLKYNITDALPPGLAVDNSTQATQGRVYVTSGNTDQAGVYAYGPGAGTFAIPLPPTVSLAMRTSGSGGGAVTASSPTTIDCASACETQIRSGAAVTLSADPDPGSTFTGWSGAGCSGTGACTVTMSEATSVGAEFEALPSSSSTPDEAQPAATAAAGSAARPRHRGRRRHHRIHHHRQIRHH